jgi:Lon protease-like protein
MDQSTAMDTIRVNFQKAVPLFPLAGVVLLPHSRQMLHIFEPRYRQMVNRVLDESGQFAMSIFEGERWKVDYHGNPPVKPVVCLAQIVQHEALPHGRFNILIQGVCRARIRSELPPTEGRLYREVVLAPVEPDEAEEDELMPVRDAMRDLFERDEFEHLTAAEALRNYVDDDEIPTAALLDVVGVAVLNDAERKYRLLEAADLDDRSEFVLSELRDLTRLIDSARRQGSTDWPKGMSFN